MNRRQKPLPRRSQNAAYRQAFERLDESLEQTSGGSNAERLQLIGRHIFGDLWDGPEQNSTVRNPE
jgi:tetrahydromethanopterin S-methyltransferase subunit G